MGCRLCRSKYCDGKNCQIIGIIKKYSPKKVDTHFFGSSPPAVFVGTYNYPNVYAGILAPALHDEFSYKNDSPEEWFREKLSIEEILGKRSSMIYSRFQNSVKQRGKFIDVMQEISMSSRICDVEFYLKEKPRLEISFNSFRAPIGNPAPLKKAVVTENIKVHNKVEKFVGDTDIKSTDSINELHASGIPVTNISKLLSSGLLGMKKNRKLTPTRWSITAVDDIISKKLIDKIKTFPIISDYIVFHDEYLGNHYEILLIPSVWGFEVIEMDSIFNVWQDYENYFGKKGYASSVTGAYYANRLGACEYLAKIKRQASVLVLREIKDAYWAPCGVGILREVTRSAFNNKPQAFITEKEALTDIQNRIKSPLYFSKSRILNEKKEQLLLNKFLA